MSPWFLASAHAANDVANFVHVNTFRSEHVSPIYHYWSIALSGFLFFILQSFTIRQLV